MVRASLRPDGAGEAGPDGAGEVGAMPGRATPIIVRLSARAAGTVDPDAGGIASAGIAVAGIRTVACEKTSAGEIPSIVRLGAARAGSGAPAAGAGCTAMGSVAAGPGIAFGATSGERDAEISAPQRPQKVASFLFCSISVPHCGQVRVAMGVAAAS